jgi:hypothetical protein
VPSSQCYVILSFYLQLIALDVSIPGMLQVPGVVGVFFAISDFRKIQ